MPRGIPKNGINKGWFKKGNINKYWLGKKRPPFSEEWKKKLSEAHLKNPTRYWLGKKRPEMTGEKCLWWKGGLEFRKKQDERNDSMYTEWVKQVKKRDNNECQLKDENCYGYNVVHHIKGWTKYPEERYNINNGITLCQYHHPRKRVEEQRLIPIFQELVGSKEKL